MSTIRILPPTLVNKIAAGEVIERPASVVKELMENSIDAGATRIDVAVEQGGLELVRVSDDGCGIAPDELSLAVASHATSKIHDADDLFRVQTLGFRGEALASIASVSRVLLRSRTPQSQAGAQLEMAGGATPQIVPCASAIGTTIEVRQLFFNTPVRRKFLRSTQTEMGHLTEAFTRIALANPHVHCSLSHNGRALYDLPVTDDWRLRIATFFGEDLAADLIEVSSSDDGVYLRGHAASPNHSRANPRLQYLFLNGRAIRDRSLQHALGEAYRGLLLTGRYPIAFLRIEMPSDQVDVNVHPTKLEVRFQESGRLYSQLLGTLRTKFLSTDLTARLQPSANERDAAIDPARIEAARRELVDWAKGQLSEQAARVDLQSIAASQTRLDRPADAARAPLELSVLARRWQPPDAASDEGDDLEHDESAEFNEPSLEELTSVAPQGPQRPLAALQLHNRYLVAESDDGMVVIDQHALHERILYEHLREKVLSGAVESQALLVPEPVDLSPAERAILLESQQVLNQLGLGVEPFGGDTVLVSRYPAMLANLRPADVLRDVVERLTAGGKNPDRRDLVDSLLHLIACKAAIKAGDRLSHDEIAELLEQRHLAHDAHHCPHGRPTALFFSREELDKQFKRI